MKITSSAIDCFSVEKAWPPGFRFHPSDEELLLYYLKRKICRRRLKPDIISETDVYKWDPEDLPEQSILKTGDRQWFFFSPRDRKYPNGARSNRATRYGYWKATGRDRTITCNSRTVGTKKTLVFYRGRAPSGKRTDWVMHEYTVDEEELKRCQTEQDYYALYKVYKKSGPGPKNGEQYGAPFKEEEWADDEYSVGNNHAVNSVKQLNAIPCVDNFGVDGEMKSPPLDDIEEIVNRVMDDQRLVQLHINGNAYAPQDAAGETQTTMLDPLVRDAIVAEHGMLLNPSGSQHGLQTSFDITQLTTSQLHSHEASEVTSAPNISEQELHFTEDFLEVDDLIGPEPALSNAQPVEDLPLDNLDGLSELDLYHDAAMFIQDIGSADQAFAANPFLNEMINQFDYQLPHPSDPDVEDDNQLWMHEQRSDVSTSAEVHPGVNPLPITVCDETSTNIPTQRNQNQAGGPNGGTDNWFISGLWGYLESIPAPPASACESGFADHTSEQTSSINRVRIRASNIAAAASNDPPAQKGKGKSKGFFYYSVVGAACAVLCVVMKDPVMKVLGRYMPL